MHLPSSKLLEQEDAVARMIVASWHEGNLDLFLSGSGYMHKCMVWSAGQHLVHLFFPFCEMCEWAVQWQIVEFTMTMCWFVVVIHSGLQLLQLVTTASPMFSPPPSFAPESTLTIILLNLTSVSKDKLICSVPIRNRNARTLKNCFQIRWFSFYWHVRSSLPPSRHLPLWRCMHKCVRGIVPTPWRICEPTAKISMLIQVLLFESTVSGISRWIEVLNWIIMEISRVLFRTLIMTMYWWS